MGYFIVRQSLCSNWFTAGEKVAEFEKEFSKKFNAKYSVMVNSGSSANLLMLAAMKKYYGWEDGDEVVLSVVGFPTTLSSILLNNLTPVFVDIELDTLNMYTESQLRNKFTSKTKAIFVSPVLGNPPNLYKLMSYNNKDHYFIPKHKGSNNIKLIIDGCDSLGTKFLDIDLYYFADIVSCSMYATHHITTGEGGMVSSHNPDLIKIVRSMSTWGRECSCTGSKNIEGCKNRFSDWLGTGDIIDHRYVFSNIGYNLKPLDMQGALGLSQLKKFDDFKKKRQYNFSAISFLYKRYIKGIKIPKATPHSDVSWFGVPIICQTKELKEKLVRHLEDNGIQTRHYFAGNILLHPAYKHLGNWKKYPNANEVLKRVFFVGCAPQYNNQVLEYIEKVLKEFK